MTTRTIYWRKVFSSGLGVGVHYWYKRGGEATTVPEFEIPPDLDQALDGNGTGKGLRVSVHSFQLWMCVLCVYGTIVRLLGVGVLQ